MPQGSVVSVTCFIFDNNSVVDTIPGIYLKVSIFVNDPTIHCTSSYPEVVVRRL